MLKPPKDFLLTDVSNGVETWTHPLDGRVWRRPLRRSFTRIEKVGFYDAPQPVQAKLRVALQEMSLSRPEKHLHDVGWREEDGEVVEAWGTLDHPDDEHFSYKIHVSPVEPFLLPSEEAPDA